MLAKYFNLNWVLLLRKLLSILLNTFCLLNCLHDLSSYPSCMIESDASTMAVKKLSKNVIINYER